MIVRSSTIIMQCRCIGLLLTLLPFAAADDVGRRSEKSALWHTRYQSQYAFFAEVKYFNPK